MAKEENPDKKKKKSEEAADYESLLDDFTAIFNDSDEESGDSKVDHDGLALSELLGEDVTMTTEPVEAEKSESGSGDELSDFTSELDGLDLKEFTESDDDGETAEKEEITIEDSTGETSTIGHGIDELADIYGGELAVNEPEEATAAADDSAVTQEIEALGFDDPAETVTPDEAVAEGADTAEESAESREPEVLDFESIDDFDVSAEEVKEEEFSIDNGMGDTSIDSVAEKPADDSAAEMILDEELTVSDSNYASILDQLDGGKAEKEETLDVTDVGELNILEDNDTGELSFVKSEGQEEESSDAETSEDSVFMDLDLDFDEEEEGFVAEEEPAVSVASPDSGEEDFLGLSGIGSESGGTAGGVGSATEVLFEGVEMNFDKQISLVTHAEILLAQKKTGEATELLQKVAEGKGETHWVAKRLRTFGTQVQKTDSPE